MKKSDLELLQPVQWHDVTGYINFICEDYLTICFIDEPLPTSANSRWGRHYAAILVYPQYYHEIRCRVDEEKEEGTGQEDYVKKQLEHEEGYGFKRRKSYPPLFEQLDTLYWDMKNATDNWIKSRDKIKEQFPKED